jgi:hypothetical protein
MCGVAATRQRRVKAASASSSSASSLASSAFSDHCHAAHVSLQIEPNDRLFLVLPVRTDTPQVRRQILWKSDTKVNPEHDYYYCGLISTDLPMALAA